MDSKSENSLSPSQLEEQLIETAVDDLLDRVDELEWVESVPAGAVRKFVYKMKHYYPWSYFIVLVPAVVYVVFNRLFPPADEFDKDK